MTEISAVGYKSRLFFLRAGFLIGEWTPSTIDITQKGIIYDQNELLNEFIKSESLFDPFWVPKTTFFENLAYFGLFFTGFAFRF